MKRFKLPKWEPVVWLAVIVTVIAVILWLIGILLTFVAIFIDSPAEGNMGGAAVITYIIAFVLSVAAGFIWDEV